MLHIGSFHPSDPLLGPSNIKEAEKSKTALLNPPCAGKEVPGLSGSLSCLSPSVRTSRLTSLAHPPPLTHIYLGHHFEGRLAKAINLCPCLVWHVLSL